MAATIQSPPSLNSYLVYVPDRPDALKARLEHLKAHNIDALPLVKAGRVPWFGSTLSHHGAEGETPAENGTVMILKAENEAEVRAIVERDIFTKEGVWNAEGCMIWPFLGK